MSITKEQALRTLDNLSSGVQALSGYRELRQFIEQSVSPPGAPAPQPDLTDERITELGHRHAWRYKHSSDPNHSHTYTFNGCALHNFARAIEREVRRSLLAASPAQEAQQPVAAGDAWWRLKVEALMHTVEVLRDALHGDRDTRGKAIINEQLAAIRADILAQQPVAAGVKAWDDTAVHSPVCRAVNRDLPESERSCVCAAGRPPSDGGQSNG